MRKKKTKSRKKKTKELSEKEIKRNKTFKLALRSILGTFSAFICIGVVYNTNRYFDLSSEMEQISSELATEQQINDNYEAEVEYLKSDEHIEKVAKEQLGMVKPTEVLFINGS